MSEFGCKRCDGELEGGRFGDDAYCPVCDLRYETDWDYVDAFEGDMAIWLTDDGTPCTREEWEADR